MIKKEWDYEGNEGINQGKSSKSMEASYYGAFIGFIGMGIVLIGALIWEWIKS